MFPINDTLDAILVGGFLFGLLFTVGSMLLGFADFGADHGADHGGDFGADANGHGHVFELFNVSSILAFITWFSGVSYLVRNGFGWLIGFALVIGLIFGLAGAWLISWFMYKFLRENSPELNPADWEEIGQIGMVTGTILPNGVGAILLERHGTRHALPARTSDGGRIERDVEVVILEVDRGVAIVKPWKELLEESDSF